SLRVSNLESLAKSFSISASKASARLSASQKSSFCFLASASSDRVSRLRCKCSLMVANENGVLSDSVAEAFDCGDEPTRASTHSAYCASTSSWQYSNDFTVRLRGFASNESNDFSTPRNTTCKGMPCCFQVS